MDTLTFRLSEAEKQLYDAVTDYVQRYYNRAIAAEKRNVAFALLVTQRRLASSVRAARTTLERGKERLHKLLQEGLGRSGIHDLDEDLLEDLPDRDRENLENQAAETLTAAETQQELMEEIESLTELIRLARIAERQEVEEGSQSRQSFRNFGRCWRRNPFGTRGRKCPSLPNRAKHSIIWRKNSDPGVILSQSFMGGRILINVSRPNANSGKPPRSCSPPRLAVKVSTCSFVR